MFTTTTQRLDGYTSRVQSGKSGSKKGSTSMGGYSKTRLKLNYNLNNDKVENMWLDFK